MDSVFDDRLANPIFMPLRATLGKFPAAPPSVAQLNRNLLVDGIAFVGQGPKSENFEEGYEPRIFLKGEVQSRENSWHDFFNALVWQTFTKTKKVINKLQYELQKSRYPDKNRTPAENMLTLFDENGAIVMTRNTALLKLIRNHEWHALFWKRREEVLHEMQVVVFGHGLYEKALNPYVGLTAQTLLIDQVVHDIDGLIAGCLGDIGASLSPSLLSPLPILGVPGFWPGNCVEAFYSNTSYFRPLRTPRNK